MRVFVAGATGKTGSLLVEALEEIGHRPVAMVREDSDTSDLPKGTTERQGDLTNLREDLLDGVDAVIFAAGSGGDTDTQATKAVDRDGAKALIDLAAQKNIQRFVMLSSVGADAPEQGPDKMEPYLKAKHDADEHLRQSGLSYTIVRPVALTDDDGNGTIDLAEQVDHEREIPRADVARVLARSVSATDMQFRTVELSSGDTEIKNALD